MKGQTENSSSSSKPGKFKWLGRLIKLIFKTIGAVAALIVLLVAGFLLFLWLEHNTSVTLPDPTGPFQVGRATYHWVDTTRSDSLAPVSNQKRELMVWIWYPAVSGQVSKTSEYLPASWQVALENSSGVFMSKFFTRDLSKVHTHSTNNTPISSKEQQFPVIIMRSGIGALATDYTTLATDLASHGYIVVGADAPYSTNVVVFPDGRVAARTLAGNPGDDEGLSFDQKNRILNKLIGIWTADTRFILDKLNELNTLERMGKFTNRLNMNAVGIFGHSFGGATAAQFCHDDNRCKAGIDIDGQPFGSVIKEGLHQPFMFILSDHSGEPGTNDILSKLKSVYDHLPVNDRLWVSITGTRHFNFSDQALLKDSHLAKLAHGLGPIDERQGLAITTKCVQSFFDVYLRNAPKQLLKKRLLLHPEVQLAMQ